jgi:ArsR family transcriptional regulator, arsenate/arsenite/antimonite-responsive transcriptional repressor
MVGTSGSIDSHRCVEYGQHIDDCQWEIVMRTSATSLVVHESDPCCASVLTAPLDVADAAAMAQGFSALADPVRLRVLSILAAAPGGEVCVCDFVGPLGKSQPTVSHHLRILSEAGLVEGERRGRWVWYSLNRARLAGLRATIGG